MALLSFPSPATNGQLYPTSPLPGQNQYQYENATQTWRLLGAATGVAPGCYGDSLTVPAFCVDAQGRLTSVSSIPFSIATPTQLGVVQIGNNVQVSGGVISILNATTLQAGVVQLNNTVTSTSTTQAATANAVKTAYDVAAAAVPNASYTAKGDIVAGTGTATYTDLPVGTNGQYLRADSAYPTGLVWSNPPAFYNLDDISGSFDGVVKTFPLTIGGVAYVPSPVSNIMVFLGGMAQTPGITEAYTVAGSSITFLTAPSAGTSFYATTIY